MEKINSQEKELTGIRINLVKTSNQLDIYAERCTFLQSLSEPTNNELHTLRDRNKQLTDNVISFQQQLSKAENTVYTQMQDIAKFQSIIDNLRSQISVLEASQQRSQHENDELRNERKQQQIQIENLLLSKRTREETDNAQRMELMNEVSGNHFQIL